MRAPQHPHQSSSLETIAVAAAAPADAQHHQPWLGFTLALVLVCAIGLLSRAGGVSALFWPANALLLGWWLRHPTMARRPAAWGLAGVIFMACDALVQTPGALSVGMNLANLVGVLCAWLYLERYGAVVLGLRQPRAVFYIGMAAVWGAAGSALVEGPVLYGVRGMEPWQAVLQSFAGAFFNFMLVLPLLLAAPRRVWQRLRAAAWWPVLRQAPKLPLVLLVAAEALAYAIPGLGALVFAVPALVWCAMAYGVLPITVLNLLLGLVKVMALAAGWLDIGPTQWYYSTSFFTGVALLSLGPLVVAVNHHLQLQTLQRLQAFVDHDHLTGALSRRTFMQRSQRRLQRLQREGEAVAVLMLDLDHFKRINDHYGHAQGDEVLRHFTALAQRHLRPEDVLGRMGGEEFALLLPKAGMQEARRVAERICQQVRNYPFVQEDGRVLYATVSIGVCVATPGLEPAPMLEALLAQADVALYEAKSGGRDQVRCVQAQGVRNTANTDGDGDGDGAATVSSAPRP